jgi:flagellar motor protein MotB
MSAPLTLAMIRRLWLWTGVLIVGLLMVIPGNTGWRLAMSALAIAVVAWACRQAGRRTVQPDSLSMLADAPNLPPDDYRLPVILVCGDSPCGLFGPFAPGVLQLRSTNEGCYVRVPSVPQLSGLVRELLSLRPGWQAQLRIVLTVSPSAHRDAAVLAGALRTFIYQLTIARTLGAPLPLMLVGYAQAATGEGPWFSWEAGESQPWVRDNGACTTLSDWQRQAGDSLECAARLRISIQLESMATWFQDQILPAFQAHVRGPGSGPLVAVAFTFVPTVPGTVDGNLWQHWSRSRTALMVDAPQGQEPSTWLPFPDPLLPLLAAGPRSTQQSRANRIALWLFVSALMLAIISSGWHNHQLVRQVADDLWRYQRVMYPPHGGQADPAQSEAAVAVLRRHALVLDNYFSQGEPLGLGLGLYRGELLRPLIWNVIGRHPVQRIAPQADGAEPTIRLNSLSLFNSGSAQLRPDATKVMIGALADIRAQPDRLIVIAGHTDAIGSPQHNLALSQARAAAVRQWLQSMGDLPADCFAVQGFGESQPIASNDTESGRTANRRVDIRLLPHAGGCTRPAEVSGVQPGAAVSGIQ